MTRNILNENQLSASAFHTYVYLVKVGKAVGVREVMRGANLSSPSVAYRNLQKLVELDLVLKDKYGNYAALEKVGLKGQIWIGKTLVPRFLVLGLIFLGFVMAEVAILVPHLLLRASIEGSFLLLTTLTVVSATIFLVEGVRYKKISK